MNAQLKPIRSEDYYAEALELMDRVFRAEEGTPEADVRDVLAILTQKDLVLLVGSRSKVSEVLSGKRDLSLRMIRALHSHLGIPAEVLISDGKSYDTASYSEFDFEAFPVQEMTANGAFKVNGN